MFDFSKTFFRTKALSALSIAGFVAATAASPLALSGEHHNHDHKHQAHHQALSMGQLFSGVAVEQDHTRAFETAPTKDNHFSAKNYLVSMKAQALGTRFFMGQAMIDGPPVAFGQTMGSKIVFFEKRRGKVYLFEDTVGQMSSDSVPGHKLLVEFPVVYEDNTQVVFDFREGMNRIFSVSEMFTSERSGHERENDEPLEVVSSYLQKVEVKGKFLSIHQLAQVKWPSDEKTGPGYKEIPVGVKYTFTPYVKNPNFQAKKTNSQKDVGFFEVQPTIEAGSAKTSVHVMRFDPSKDLTFHVSPNVPADFKQAVIDGIVYWNRAFGRDFIKVEELPEGVTPHDPGYNIVQWVQFDQAGFAYADMQADPRTGELMQAHVYMTSTFALGGIKRGKKMLLTWADELERNYALANKDKAMSFGLKGFTQNHVCRHSGTPLDPQVVDLLVRGETVSNKDKAILRFAQDYVRSVVAHEIGHTLGFRHNFAGNLGASLTPEDYQSTLLHYLQTGDVREDIFSTTSVMDYTGTVDSTLQGAHIRLEHRPFEYDQLAVDWGYKGKSLEEIKNDSESGKLPLFCTDPHKNKYVDCRVWDSMGDTVSSAHFFWKRALAKVGKDFAFKFLTYKTSPKSTQLSTSVMTMPLDPEGHAKQVVSAWFSELITQLSDEARFLSVYKEFPFVTSFNERNYVEKTDDLKRERVELLGGVEEVLFKVLTGEKFHRKELSIDGANWEADFLKLVESEEFQKGTLADGKLYEFSLSEIDYMKGIYEEYFALFEEAFVSAMLDAYVGKFNMRGKEKTLFEAYGDVNAESLEAALKKVAAHYLLKEHDSERIRGEVADGVVVDFKAPAYDHDVRMKALKLLTKTSHTDMLDFNFVAKKELKKSLSDQMKANLGDRKFSDVDWTEASRALHHWALEERKLINAL